jgi:hypothetical protein
MDNFSAPFPIVQQPSISQDPLKAALMRQQALLKIQQASNSAGKGNFNGLSDEALSPSAKEIGGLVSPTSGAPEYGPRAGIMPPLPSQDVSEPPGGVSAEPANATEEDPGPTDIRPKPDSTATTPVAAAADPLEKELGGDPTDKPSGTFWDNPASSEALIAFGSAMLRAPNFNTGLANGAEAVSKALEPYKMPSRAEVARLTMAAKLKRYASGEDTPTAKNGFMGAESGYDAQGRHWDRIFDEAKRRFVYQGPGGVIQDHQPDGYERAPDSGTARQSKADVDALDAARTAAENAPMQIGRLDAMDREFSKAGGGAGYFAAGLRGVAGMLGMDVPGVNLGSKDAMEAFKNQIITDLRKGERGLGQFTEGEQKVLIDQIGSLGTDKRAFHTLVGLMKFKHQTDAQIMDAYNNSGSTENYKKFAYQWKREHKYQEQFTELATKNKSFEEDKKPPAPSAAPGAPQVDPNDPDRQYYK